MSRKAALARRPGIAKAPFGQRDRARASRRAAGWRGQRAKTIGVKQIWQMKGVSERV